MIELDNRTALQINTDIIDKIASSFTQKDIELIITTNEEIKEINSEHRGINRETDVLSFPYKDTPMAPLGSIVISQCYVQNIAKELGHTESQEFALLFIHGLLHLLGFDHEIDDGEMREEEAKIIKKFNLPESLITRNQN